MSLKTATAHLSGDPTQWRAAYIANLIDASGEKFEMVFQVPETGTIDRVGFMTGTVTTPQTLKAGLQTLSSGNASGSAYGSMVAGTQASPASNTYYEVTLGTPATATRGNKVALVVEYNATVGNLNINSGQKWFNQNFPYCGLFTGSWAKSGDHPIGHVRYTNGKYYPISGAPASAWNFQSYASNSTPDERALRFKLGFRARLNGVFLRLGTGSGNVDIVLTDANDNVLTSYTIVTGEALGTGNDLHRIIFNAAVTIVPNQYYRVSVRPASTNTCDLAEFTVGNAAYLDGFGGGQDFHLSTRTNAGAWTNTLTTRPGIELIYDMLDNGMNSGWVRT